MKRLGVHLTLADGIPHLMKEIQLLNINTVQIFNGNPQAYKLSLTMDEEKVIKLRNGLNEHNIFPLVIHSPYLINLGSLKEDVALKSAQTLENELRTLEYFDGGYLVFHAGSSRSPINENRFLYLLENLLNQTPSNIHILLENCSGGQSSRIDYLRSLIRKLGNPENLSLCLDTSHLFAAGYDLRVIDVINQVFEEADDKIKLIHLNDSKTPLGSFVDRHEHLGKGMIGHLGLSQFIHSQVIKDIPIILETPKDNPFSDFDNLKIARQIIGKDSI